MISMKLVRLAEQCIFALTIAFAAVWTRSAQSKFDTEFRLRAILTKYLESGASAYLAFFTIIILLALSIFILLRVLARFSSSAQVLRVIGALVAFEALPIAWFWVYGLSPLQYHWQVIAARFSPIEIAASTMLLLLYLGHKWPLPKWLTAVLVSVHCSAWVFVIVEKPFAGVIEVLWATVMLASVLAWYVFESALGGGNERRVL